MPHFLLYGPPGTGKTSTMLAFSRDLFREHYSTRVIEFNASDDRGINAVREKITHEAKKYVGEVTCEDGHIIPPYKIIILDEADSMTDEAQDALRVIIEEYSTVTRFCFICNYISKITQAIKSRCSTIHFKRLDNESMIQKLSGIAKTESMDIDSSMINTIIEVSNGDMRRAITLLQNFKSVYNYKRTLNKKFSDMTIAELNFVSTIKAPSERAIEITDKDIYNVATYIDMEKAAEIIDSVVIKCKNIIQIHKLAKTVIGLGYPIDNVLTQLQKVILSHPKISDIQKAYIYKYAGPIFYKIKECANEYIQLLDYLAAINGVLHKRKMYILATV